MVSETHFGRKALIDFFRGPDKLVERGWQREDCKEGVITFVKTKGRNQVKIQAAPDRLTIRHGWEVDIGDGPTKRAVKGLADITFKQNGTTITYQPNTEGGNRLTLGYDQSGTLRSSELIGKKTFTPEEVQEQLNRWQFPRTATEDRIEPDELALESVNSAEKGKMIFDPRKHFLRFQ